MCRASIHRWIVALALVATLGLTAAQPAAAADLSDLRVLDRLDNAWSALTAGPAAFWETLRGWFGATEKSTAAGLPPPPAEDAAWTIDPNGGH